MPPTSLLLAQDSFRPRNKCEEVGVTPGQGRVRVQVDHTDEEGLWSVKTSKQGNFKCPCPRHQREPEITLSRTYETKLRFRIYKSVRLRLGFVQ